MIRCCGHRGTHPRPAGRPATGRTHPSGTALPRRATDTADNSAGRARQPRGNRRQARAGRARSPCATPRAQQPPARCRLRRHHRDTGRDRPVSDATTRIARDLRGEDDLADERALTDSQRFRAAARVPDGVRHVQRRHVPSRRSTPLCAAAEILASLGVAVLVKSGPDFEAGNDHGSHLIDALTEPGA